MAAPTASKKKGGMFAPLSSLADNLPALILRLVLLMVFDAWAITMVWRFMRDGAAGLSVAMFVVVLAINVILLRTEAAPMRWIIPGLAFMAMFHIYPVVFTIFTAFTNYGDGHLIEKPLAIRQIEREVYLPEDAQVYNWVAFRDPSGKFALWLTGADGSVFFATQDGEGAAAEELDDLGPLNEAGVPTSVGEYQLLPPAQRLAILGSLQNLTFGDEDFAARVTSGTAAARMLQRYAYDASLDAMIDQRDGTVYTAQDGAFVSPEGRQLIPGFPVVVGMRNFTRVFTSPVIRGPLILIFIWTFAYALFSVLLTFALGLFLATVLNDPAVPFRRTIRVLMIIPYSIPAFISVLIWRGMFNPILGIVGAQWDPGWFSDPFWAKIGILVVNTWLGYAYMFLITTGALQGIPGDIYEAAKVDGAGGFYQFRTITLPLLLVAVGPLLIGSFAFNFNNFTIIDLYNGGGPPIAGTSAPAGHTDILISFTYRLAFGGGRGADYGLAAAISIIIFIIVAIITLFNFRYTGMLEEVSENV